MNGFVLMLDSNGDILHFKLNAYAITVIYSVFC